MGVGPGPKSLGGGGGGGGESSEPRGLAAIAEYGVGHQDPETGLFESYDVPEAVTSPGVSVLDLVGEWPLLVADFATEYGIRIETARGMSWIEFHALLSGLLSTDSRLRRRFAPEEE